MLKFILLKVIQGVFIVRPNQPVLLILVLALIRNHILILVYTLIMLGILIVMDTLTSMKME